MFILVTCSYSFTQAYRYQTYDFYYKYKTGNTWTDWLYVGETNDVVITAISGTKKILINSTEHQTYYINSHNAYYDFDNDYTIDYHCYDQSALSCLLRFIKRSNGTVQCYIYYADVAYMYNTSPF